MSLKLLSNAKGKDTMMLLWISTDKFWRTTNISYIFVALEQNVYKIICVACPAKVDMHFTIVYVQVCLYLVNLYFAKNKWRSKSRLWIILKHLRSKAMRSNKKKSIIVREITQFANFSNHSTFLNVYLK